MGGARFYGIGNEYMGAVIGACCILLAAPFTQTLEQCVSGVSGVQAFLRKTQHPTPNTYLRSAPFSFSSQFCFFITAILIMGAPSLGAKVGAVPSAGAALGMALLIRWARDEFVSERLR